jgi:hypothetical protein
LGKNQITSQFSENGKNESLDWTEYLSILIQLNVDIIIINTVHNKKGQKKVSILCNKQRERAHPPLCVCTTCWYQEYNNWYNNFNNDSGWGRGRNCPAFVTWIYGSETNTNNPSHTRSSQVVVHMIHRAVYDKDNIVGFVRKQCAYDHRDYSTSPYRASTHLYATHSQFNTAEQGN